MALSIKTNEADRLARSLARLSVESPTEAVTEAHLSMRLALLAERLRPAYDTSPVTKEEWDAA